MHSRDLQIDYKHILVYNTHGENFDLTMSIPMERSHLQTCHIDGSTLTECLRAAG